MDQYQTISKTHQEKVTQLQPGFHNQMRTSVNTGVRESHDPCNCAIPATSVKSMESDKSL
jgi:hypothetical protein